jgi:hypothetical protein
MKNISTGFGLCIVGLGIAAWPVLDRLMPQANAVGVGSVAPAVAAAALAQDPPAPTIVWYQAVATSPTTTLPYVTLSSKAFWLVRAWSDGKVEARWVEAGGDGWNIGRTQLSACAAPPAAAPCVGPWIVISDPGEGLTFAADLNFDEAVDGVDLGMMLAKWGPAPRNPVPPSDCPLALINP